MMGGLSGHELGRRAEEIALEHLLSMGLLLRERNWRSGHKEIDLIMESEQYLHIVEVRARSSNVVLDPKDSVGWKKQRLIIKAARDYINMKGVSKEISFDIVSIVWSGTKLNIEYIPSAYYPFYI